MKTKKSPFISEKEKDKINAARSYTERFELLMRLIRINRILKSAKIIPGSK